MNAPTCTSATNPSGPAASNATERSGASYYPASLTAAVAVPLALGTVAISLKLLLRRARAVAKWLDDDASRVWSDGSTMLDCSNEELHRSVIQSAIDRGSTALASENTTKSIHANPSKYYETSSSSGASSENNDAIVQSAPTNNDEDVPNNNTTIGESPNSNRTPRRMTKQVGGIASHKRPVLALDRFVLKPLKLSTRSRGNFSGNDGKTCSNRDSGIEEKELSSNNKVSSQSATTDERESKAYRGVREVAFYEALKFASTLPPDFGTCSRLFQRVGEGANTLGTDDAEVRQGLMYLLSLYNDASPVRISGTDSGIRTVNASFIQSCRHFCIGYHGGIQNATIEKLISVRPLPVQSNSELISNTMQSNLNLSYHDSVALSIAYYAGDSAVLSSIQSYVNAWCMLLKEVEALKRLAEITPPYFGVVDLDSLEEGRDQSTLALQPLRKPHLLLQNLTAPYRHPNIIDIKMGTQTYEPTAPMVKQKREAGKYLQQTEFGFRVVGMRVYNPSAAADDGEDEYTSWGKKFGVNLKTRDDVIQALSTFFLGDELCGGTSYSRHVLSSVMKQLAQIEEFFEEENSTLAFYASSILIVYDGHEPGGDMPTSLAYQEPILKMIDFAHVCRQAGGDAGYLKGVKSLSSMLKEVQKRMV